MTKHNLVPVFTGQLQNQNTLLCNARDLHAFLGVGRDFSTWIKERIAEYGFIEGEDYSPVLGNRSDGLSGKPRTDYHLTMNMAKELGMVERNDKGRQIRRYFIACEQALANPVELPPPPKPQIKTRDDLSFTRRDEEGRLVNWSVAHDRNGNWGEGVAKGEHFFSEVVELAAHDEKEAFHAVRFALSGSLDFKRGPGTEFQNGGWGAEDGFVEAISRTVIDGLRACKGGQESFDPKGGDKKRGRPALPKPKNSAMPSLPIPAQQALVLH